MSTAASEVPAPVRRAILPGSRMVRVRRWIADPLSELDRGRQLGDVVFSQAGPRQMAFLYLPRHVERVLLTNVGNYNKNTRGYRAMRVAMGNGLVTSQGELWKRQRRIANPAFRRKAIAAMAETMVDCAADLSERWAATAAEGGSRDVAADMTAVTLRIATRTFFSMDVRGAEASRIGEATGAVVSQFLFHLAFPVSRPEFLPTPGNFRYWRGLRFLDRTVNEVVSQRRASEERPYDLLSMFLDAEDEETGQGMSDEQLRDELITMLAAGHETTANALAWTLHLLAEHPEQLARVQGELDEVLGGRAPTGADVRELPVLDRVLKEGMRLFPPAWTHARHAEEEDDLDGVILPAGTHALLPQWSIHRDPRWWTEPTRFDPDRFLPERSVGRPKFAYFPFSGGQRKCIGDRFAKMEALLVLATLLQRFDLRPDRTVPIVTDPGVTLRPKHGVSLYLRERAP